MKCYNESILEFILKKNLNLSWKMMKNPKSKTLCLDTYELLEGYDWEFETLKIGLPSIGQQGTLWPYPYWGGGALSAQAILSS